jgi:hypothetical protein
LYTTKDKLYDLYFYHDCSHTLEVVSAVKELSIAEKLSPLESEMVIIAAWFHDTDISKDLKIMKTKVYALFLIF